MFAQGRASDPNEKPLAEGETGHPISSLASIFGSSKYRFYVAKGDRYIIVTKTLLIEESDRWILRGSEESKVSVEKDESIVLSVTKDGKVVKSAEKLGDTTIAVLVFLKNEVVVVDTVHHSVGVISARPKRN